MSDLTIQELKEKLAMVERDLVNLKADAGGDRKISVLTEYRDYIADEIKFLENENRSRESTGQ